MLTLRGWYSVRPDAVHSAFAKDATSSERDPCSNDYVFPFIGVVAKNDCCFC